MNLSDNFLQKILHWPHLAESIFRMAFEKSEFIRLLRESRGFCQSYVAQEIGLSLTAYSRIERGKVRMKDRHFLALLTLLSSPPLPETCRAFICGSLLIREKQVQNWMKDVLQVMQDNSSLLEVKDLLNAHGLNNYREDKS